MRTEGLARAGLRVQRGAKTGVGLELGLGPRPVPEPPHVAVLVGEEAVRVVAAVLVVAEAAAEDGGRLAPRPRAAEAAHHLLLRAHVARASAAHRAPRRARRHLGPPDGRASEERTATKLSQRKTESEGEKSREKQRDRERRGERLGDAAAGDLESLRTEKGHQVRGPSAAGEDVEEERDREGRRAEGRWEWRAAGRRRGARAPERERGAGGPEGRTTRGAERRELSGGSLLGAGLCLRFPRPPHSVLSVCMRVLGAPRD